MPPPAAALPYRLKFCAHFGEINSRFQTLVDELAEVVAYLHHREHGWRNAKAGICRAREGIMRRVSMVVLRETARHITRGLEIVGPQCVQERAAVSYTHLTLPTKA